jgi:hypothetical protein
MAPAPTAGAIMGCIGIMGGGAATGGGGGWFVSPIGSATSRERPTPTRLLQHKKEEPNYKLKSFHLFLEASY